MNKSQQAQRSINKSLHVLDTCSPECPLHSERSRRQMRQRKPDPLKCVTHFISETPLKFLPAAGCSSAHGHRTRSALDVRSSRPQALLDLSDLHGLLHGLNGGNLSLFNERAVPPILRNDHLECLLEYLRLDQLAHVFHAGSPNT